MAELPDIVLLTIDALRPDHLSYHEYHRETPTHDTLADEWIHASTAISVSSHTHEAMSTQLTKECPNMGINTCDVRAPPMCEKTSEKSSVEHLLNLSRWIK